jgi:hypothetical protein
MAEPQPEDGGERRGFYLGSRNAEAGEDLDTGTPLDPGATDGMGADDESPP